MIFKLSKGLTLMELMVGVAILAIMAAGLLMAYASSILLNQTSINLVQAASDAEFILEEMKGVSYSEIGQYQPPELENLKDQEIEIEVSEKNGLSEIIVTVNWKQGNRERDFRLFTIIHE